MGNWRVTGAQHLSVSVMCQQRQSCFFNSICLCYKCISSIWKKHIATIECRCFPIVAHGTGNWPEPELGTSCSHPPMTGAMTANQRRVFLAGDQSQAGVWMGKDTGRSKGIDPAVDQYLDIWDRLASAVPSYGRSCKQCSCAGNCLIKNE